MSENGKEAVRRRFAKFVEVPRHNAGQFQSADIDTAVTDDQSIEVTEDGVARGFVAKHGDIVRFDHVASKWFIWVGDHWKRDETQQAFQWSRELARVASIDSDGSEFKNARKASFGLVPLTFRSLNSFMRPFVRMPRGFCHPAMSGVGVGCKTH